MEPIRVENLTFRYPESTSPALRNLNFSVRSGEFILIAGPSGCGKSTLLRLLKREIAPIGISEGCILLFGKKPTDLDPKTSAESIGFVAQNPESQIVTDRVWHELAFGLENTGTPTPILRRRVAETASYFGIQTRFRKSTDELSGGQKQLLNLASVTAMQPRILILDEPTAYLDPIAASNFVATLRKLNRETGVTVLIAEHRSEDLFESADRVLFLDRGEQICFAPPRRVALDLLRSENTSYHRFLPTAARLFSQNSDSETSEPIPLSVREGRNYLEKRLVPIPEERFRALPPPKPSRKPSKEKPLLSLKNVWFRYEKNGEDVLRDFSFSLFEGEICAFVGGNGTGKTTAMNLAAGLKKPYRGSVKFRGKPIETYRNGELYRKGLSFLPQNPQTIFLCDTVRGDFRRISNALGVAESEREEKIADIETRTDIAAYSNRHPYDLSGGELQKCALAAVLLSEPQLLLLDEPTKGMDAESKFRLRSTLLALRDAGTSVLFVTHDLDFAAQTADRCAMIFDGEVVSSDPPAEFFAKNRFYTTEVNRIAGDYFPDAVTFERLRELRSAVGETEE